ncbi:Uncharacterised protein [Yersinia intermedia]|nr:Uncharacterised protein [Yersinia intermedia]
MSENYRVALWNIVIRSISKIAGEGYSWRGGIMVGRAGLLDIMVGRAGFEPATN